jgi:hypothetical protein
MKRLNNPRQLRGLAILSQPQTVREIKKNHWMVKSQFGNGEYEIESHTCRSRNNPTWICTCPDHQTRNVMCKHIFAVHFSLQLREKVEHNAAPRQRSMLSARIARTRVLLHAAKERQDLEKSNGTGVKTAVTGSPLTRDSHK